MMLPEERWLCSDGEGRTSHTRPLPTAMLSESPVEPDRRYLLSGHAVMMRNLLSAPPSHTTSREAHQSLC